MNSELRRRHARMAAACAAIAVCIAFARVLISGSNERFGLQRIIEDRRIGVQLGDSLLAKLGIAPVVYADTLFFYGETLEDCVRELDAPLRSLGVVRELIIQDACLSRRVLMELCDVIQGANQIALIRCIVDDESGQALCECDGLQSVELYQCIAAPSVFGPSGVDAPEYTTVGTPKIVYSESFIRGLGSIRGLKRVTIGDVTARRNSVAEVIVQRNLPGCRVEVYDELEVVRRQ